MKDLSDFCEEDVLDYASYILDMRLREPSHIITSPKDTKRYLRLHFSGIEHESFGVFYLDSQHRVIEFDGNMFRGTINAAVVYPREVVKASLSFNAAAVIFAHNHPSGVSNPSQSDQRITERLKAALDLVDVRVLDHFVVGDSETYSFAEHGLI